MFYSHTYLTRKGPLSTVWIAAHLQHRLKKSHYAATDIPSAVLRIMDPGAPLALRMSGHLLLGVVRIYSKKVDYLHQDCKDALTGLHKAFATLQFVQPEEARPAPFQSVTLPGTFDLDAQTIDDQIDYNWSEDHHLRNPEDITLTDRISVTMDHYVTVSFDEDIIMMDSSHTEVLPDSGPVPDSGTVPMEQDINPQSPATNVVGAEDLGPSTQRESPTIQHTGGMGTSVHSPLQATQDKSVERVRHANISLENLPVFPGVEDKDAGPNEGSRDANNDYNQENFQVFPNREEEDAEPNIVLDQTMSDVSRMSQGLDREELSVPSQQQFGPPTPPTSQGGTLDAQAHGDNAPNFQLKESLPRQQPQQRGRKRKQFYDKPIVLSNGFMRKALNNTHDILRKRREVPSSSLGTWKLNNSRRKELIFDQPLLTGVGKDLLDIYTSEYVQSRPHLVISEGDHADADIAETSPTDQSPDDPVPATDQPPEEPIPATGQTPEELIAANIQTVEAIPDSSPAASFDMEVEQVRNVAVTPPPTFPAHIGVEGDSRSFDRRDDTMTSPHNVPIASLSTNIASERMQTPSYAVSPSAHGSETMQTPDTDTHHLIHSSMTDELDFLLTMDNNISASSQGTSGSYKTLSERTRHVAQYLQRLSPITSILEEPTTELSLKQILEGKTRHIAARMFYEVLVLKSSELVDVQQEEPYGDVSLKLTHTSNAQS